MRGAAHAATLKLVGFGSPHAGAEYCVTSCDLGVFVDQAAEPIAPEDPDIGAC